MVRKRKNTNRNFPPQKYKWPTNISEIVPSTIREMQIKSHNEINFIFRQNVYYQKDKVANGGEVL